MILHLFRFIISLVFIPLLVTSASPDASHHLELPERSSGKYVFQTGDTSYLADFEHPRVSFSGYFHETAAAMTNRDRAALVTVIYTDQRLVDKDLLEDLVTRYRQQDDVYSEAFLEGIYICSTSKYKSVFDRSALDFLSESNTKYLFVDASSFSYSTNITGPYIISYVKTEIAVKKTTPVTHDSAKEATEQAILSIPTNNLPPGPYVAKIDRNAVTLSVVYRLYPDDYSNFLFGAYKIGDGDDGGTFKAVDVFEPKFGNALIPVPSRIYSWNDGRSLAGQRIAIKDLYDVKGLQTAGGSHAWAAITGAANVSAPSVQQIIDLGGVIVGKYKTAQFAAGLNPWDWIDVHYPFNPRGDGHLTCSGSSSGGGCAIAAYEWLDFAIGSDTGGSMRVPAAVAGVYGNRPSQGLMNMQGVLPISEALDTAGVFSRDPIRWLIFAKAWYQPFLHQPVSVTGLSPLVVPDTTAFPKKLLYLTNYLPLANPEAEALLQQFIGNLTTIFDLQVSKFDLISALKSAQTTPPILDAINSTEDDILDGKGHWDVIARPLIAEWASLNDGRFPPIETVWRSTWQNYSSFNFSDEERHARYKLRLQGKKFATDWFESNILFETEESCSDSIMIYDIGTQGLPRYRDEKTNNDTGTFKYYIENGDGKSKWELAKDFVGNGICPSFGCVDFTLPIGQVPYRSNVTFVEEMMPVTVSLVARRGCDFMLFNMVEKLAREEVLKTVKTGREAF